MRGGKRTYNAVLPQYKNKHFIAVVEDLVKQSSYYICSEDILDKIIDPDCDKESRRYLKNRVSTVLAGGAREGRWIRSANTKGYYGLPDSKDLSANPKTFPSELHGEIVTKVIELFSEEVGSRLITANLAHQLADFIWERIHEQC